MLVGYQRGQRQQTGGRGPNRKLALLTVENRGDNLICVWGSSTPHTCLRSTAEHSASFTATHRFTLINSKMISLNVNMYSMGHERGFVVFSPGFCVGFCQTTDAKPIHYGCLPQRTRTREHDIMCTWRTPRMGTKLQGAQRGRLLTWLPHDAHLIYCATYMYSS